MCWYIFVQKIVYVGVSTPAAKKPPKKRDKTTPPSLTDQKWTFLIHSVILVCMTNVERGGIEKKSHLAKLMTANFALFSGRQSAFYLKVKCHVFPSLTDWMRFLCLFHLHADVRWRCRKSECGSFCTKIIGHGCPSKKRRNVFCPVTLCFICGFASWQLLL